MLILPMCFTECRTKLPVSFCCSKIKPKGTMHHSSSQLKIFSFAMQVEASSLGIELVTLVEINETIKPFVEQYYRPLTRDIACKSKMNLLLQQCLETKKAPQVHRTLTRISVDKVDRHSNTWQCNAHSSSFQNLTVSKCSNALHTNWLIMQSS